MIDDHRGSLSQSGLTSRRLALEFRPDNRFARGKANIVDLWVTVRSCGSFIVDFFARCHYYMPQGRSNTYICKSFLLISIHDYWSTSCYEIQIAAYRYCRNPCDAVDGSKFVTAV
jgi:hypothetical protein